MDRTPDSTAIPVVDLSAPPADVARAVRAACAEWGFFNLVGHGLDEGLRAQVTAEAKAFFAAPAAAKRGLSRSRDNPWGYYDRELTKTRRDKKEILDVGPDAARDVTGDVFQGKTPFPQWQPHLEPAVRAWFAACENLCLRLLRPVAEGLGATPEALAGDFVGGHTSFLRLNHYPTHDPAGDEVDRPAGLGIHHHTDAGALTVLLTDGEPGLQVEKGGAWIPVDPVPGGLVVNIGDMAQVWSNDAYVAPVHRVLAMEDRPRLSLAFFFNPAYPAVIRPLPSRTGPPRYRDLPWAEFRRRRADGDFADYGTEVQIAEWRI